MMDDHFRRMGITVVALLVLLTTAAGRLGAAPVGYGNSVIDIQGTPASYTYCSQTPAADVTYDVFGTPVNLATQAGTILCVGTFASGVVTSSCASYPDAGQISYDGSTADLFLSNVMGTIPASIGDVMLVGETTDAFDSYVLGSSIPNCPLNPSEFSAHHAGVGALNAFEKIATPTGGDVSISSDTTMVNLFTLGEVRVAVDVTFAQVDTAGETTAGARAQSAVPLPANYSADVGGYKAPYIGVLTSAAVSGMITICGRYDDANDDGILDGTSVREADLSLLRAEGVSPAFVDRTSSRDPVGNAICAEMSALAPIVVAVRTNGSCGPGDEGNPCNDGNACTTNDTCVSEVCGGSAASCDDANPCTDDACVGITGCVSTPNVAACDDALFCNGIDTCSGGACVHAGDPCAGGAECDDACNETADNCAAPAGAGCTDDGNPCTGDQCDGLGACQHPFNSAPCADDGNGCTDDVCAAGSCSHPDNNATCDDSDACTGAGTCGGGTCQPGAPTQVCGDGVPCGSEECDDGNVTNGDGCTAQCQTQVCGNGTVEPGEQCDDYNVNNGDGCSSTCLFDVCSFTGTWVGDSTVPDLIVRSIVDANGNLIGAYTMGGMAEPAVVSGTVVGSTATVTIPGGTVFTAVLTNCGTVQYTSPFTFSVTRISYTVCGDATVDPGEQCDDGNFASGDLCSGHCLLPDCGNGIVNQYEECDDGNQTNDATCDSNCTRPGCGNSIIDAGEQCDDGNQIDTDACNQTCLLSNCGNNSLDAGEECDDGNLTDDDGCARNCTLQGCGNGVIETDEDCDDDNTGDCDGCSATCVSESDDDDDGVLDSCDNCPADFNPSQRDFDDDSIGDPCDAPIEVATGTGSDVTVAADLTMADPLVISPISAVNITFDQVTGGGTTEVTVSEAPANELLGGNFKLNSSGTLLHLTTTATFSGSIDVCLTYVDSGLTPEQEGDLRFLHEEGANNWVDRTISIDTDANILCGQVTSFSRFAFGIAVQSFSKVRASMRQELPSATTDRLKRLVTKFSPPAGTSINPAQTGATLTLSQLGTAVFQRTITPAQWEVVKAGKLYRFEDQSGQLAGGITKAKLKQSPRGVILKIAGTDLDLSGLASGDVELRLDFGSETIVSVVACEAKPNSDHVTLRCSY